MAEPNTPAEDRRQGLQRSRRVAVGAAVGAAAILTGTIAIANAAPDHQGTATTGAGRSTSSEDRETYDDDSQDAVPFSPQSQSSSGAVSQVPIQPQTRSGGS